MTDSVRIGFIGCGGNARGHMRGVAGVECARVAACCDVVEQIAADAAEPYGAAVYPDLHRMLGEEPLEAVVISIPMHLHGEPERAVIAAGLPFLVEKPVARDMALAREIEALVADAGLLTAVGYQLRYSRATARARELLDGQTVAMVVGSYWCGIGRGHGGRWTFQFDKSGGQILEQATHTIDLMRYFAGEVEEVSALAASRAVDDIDCPDVTAVQWRHSSGALGSITTSWSLSPGDWQYANNVHILGDGLRLHWTTAGLTAKLPDGGEESTPGGDFPLDAAFCEAVRTGDDSGILSPYADGVRTMAVSIAAIESAARGTPVRVADVG